MLEKDVLITTKYGLMPSFVVCPDEPGAFPPVIMYMDAPGYREELKHMARRVAKAGYICVLPDLYYRLGTVRFDLSHRTDAMSAVIRPCMLSLTEEMVTDDTAGIIGFLDGHEKAKPGKLGCVGYCMSGSFITTVAGRFPHRMAAAASIYGVNIVTGKENSPHLLLDRVKGELYYAFAEVDASVPETVIATLREGLDKNNVRSTVKIFPGTHHGYSFWARAVYETKAAEQTWDDLFDLWARNLKA